MKKIIMAALLPWLCLALLQAQDQSIPQKLRYLYAALDKSKVTTGYLWNQSLCFASPSDYRGQLDTFYANPDVFGMLYGALRNSFVRPAGGNLPSPAIYLDRIKTPPTDGSIPLAIMAMQFDRIRPDALTNQLLTYDGKQILDVPDREISPYYQDTVYLATPLKTEINNLSPTFSLPNDLWFSNLNETPVISLDAGDGLGWRTISPDGLLTAQYSGTGSKILRIRFQFTNLTTYASAKILVVAGDNLSGISERSGLTWPQDLYEAIPVTSTKTYMGASGQATMHVFYNTSNCNGAKRMLRPLIVIEGYEEPGVTQSTYNRMFELLNNKDWSSGSGDNLTDYLYPAEYDLVYIDLANGSDWIQRNAYVVEEVIKKVNEMKVAAGSTEQNVVIGVSMGGVAGMYALKDMKTNGPSHDTRLFITYDSPLQGANIPIGTQCLIKFMVDNLEDYAGGNISIPSIDAVWNAIQAPSPRQLLLNHINTFPSIGAPNLQTAFLAELNGLGSLDMRHVALGNGAGNGTILENSMIAGSPFFDLSGQFVQCEEFPSGSGVIHCGDVNFEITLRATGSFTSTVVFHGRIERNEPWPPSSQYTEWTVTQTSAPYDVMPGGTSNLGVGPLGTATGGLTSSLTSAGVVVTGPGLTVSQHCFIPIFSSMNATIPTVFTTPQGCGSASRCSASNSTEITSPYTGFAEYNQFHIALDSRIAGVLIDELVINSPAPTPNLLESLTNQSLTTYFNAGIGVYATAIPNLTISTSSGKLSINNTGKIGFAVGNEPNSPDDYLEAYMKCGTLITVESGAKIVVGADGGIKHGVLNITSGATIHIKSGGKLNVTSNQSLLLIKPGGRLILDPGAIVQLDHPGANIRIEGEIVVNGDIVFTGQGYFDFAGKPNQLVFGPSYQVFNLTGYNKTSRMAKLTTSVAINQSHRLNWSNGLVEAGSNFQISDLSGLTFNNMTFTGEYLCSIENGAQQMFKQCDFIGLNRAILANHTASITINRSNFVDVSEPVWGSDNYGYLTIESSHFEGYGHGIPAVFWTESAPVVVTYSTFEGGENNSALWLYKIPFVLLDGSAFYNHLSSSINGSSGDSQLGGAFPAVFMDKGLCLVKNTLFEGNSVGIKSLDLPAEGWEPAAVLAFNNSGFFNNVAGIFINGTETDGLTLADCTTFQNNEDGIRGRNITLMLDSHYTSTWSEDTDTPNKFIRQAGVTDAHVSVCYDFPSKAQASKNMRNNWWGTYDPGTNSSVYDTNLDPFISLFDNTCNLITAQEVVAPRLERVPDACITAGRPAEFGSSDPVSECTVIANSEDNSTVNQKFHEGYYLITADSIEEGLNALQPVADLWQSDMSTYSDNCRAYIASARAIVEGYGSITQNRKRVFDRPVNSNQPLAIQPNPAKDQFKIIVPSGALLIQVMDMRGKLISESVNLTSLSEWNAALWPSGMYIIHAWGKDGVMRTGKLVVQ